MALLCCKLQILRIMISSVNNNHVFHPTCHKYLVKLYKSQVTGAYKRPCSCVSQVGMEGFSGLCCPLPIALRHTFPRYPDLANLLCLTLDMCLWMNNQHLHAFASHATTDDSLVGMLWVFP